MDMKTYQRKALNVNMVPPEFKLLHAVLGLVGEAGEVAEKFKKMYRDKGGLMNEAFKADIRKECGDVLWYISDVCTQVGLSLDDVACYNIEKLESRQARGVLGGSGDDR